MVILDVSAEVLTKLIPALTTPDLARIDGSFTDLSKTRELAAVHTGRGTASSPFRRGGDGGTPGTVDDPLASGYVLAEGAPPVPVPVPYSGSLHRALPRCRRADDSRDQGRGPAPRTSVDAQKQDFGRTVSLTHLILQRDSTSGGSSSFMLR